MDDIGELCSDYICVNNRLSHLLEVVGGVEELVDAVRGGDDGACGDLCSQGEVGDQVQIGGIPAGADGGDGEVVLLGLSCFFAEGEEF